MPHEDEHAPDEAVARTLGRFDPRWFPTVLATGQSRVSAAGPVVASRLEELLTFYRLERRRIRRYARFVLDDDDGRAADDLVLRAFRRLCQDPPPFPGGPGPAVRAVIRAESRLPSDALEES
jgi:hypothetical protein